MSKRYVDICVISDVHLGTFGSRAKELLAYLKSIQPKLLILNGDIIDGWQFSKHYFPVSHFNVIKEVLSLIAAGTKVVYITGNHDEMLRKYSDVRLGDMLLTDKYVVEINNQNYWFFHGDVFDNTTTGTAKIFAKLGGYGYDFLILLNVFVNFILKISGREKISFSKKIKNKVKKAVQFINNFEHTCAALAIDQQYHYVVCGHIHQPCIKQIQIKQGQVTYMNSGDWIENLSSLEFVNNQWQIYYHQNQADAPSTPQQLHPVKLAS